MSDPTAPRPVTFSRRQAALSALPVLYDYEIPPEVVEGLKRAATIDGAKAAVKGLRMGRATTFELDRKLLCASAVKMHGKRGPFWTHHTPGLIKRRSQHGVENVQRFVGEMPIEEWAGVSKDAVLDGIATAVRIENPGAGMTMGRFGRYFARKEEVAAHAPNSKKMEAMMDALGMRFGNVPADLRIPFNIDGGIQVSSHSSNGLPTLGSTDDPLDMEQCIGIALDQLREVRLSYSVGSTAGVQRYYRSRLETHPHMMCDILKAKTETVTTTKIAERELRAYVCRPRWLNLVEGTVTQVLKRASRTILDDNTLHCALGVSLAHGGGRKLVQALDAQLEREQKAWVVHGDDSWVTVWDGTRLHLFDLDVSSMDLSIRRETLRPAVAAYCRELAKCDPAVAALKEAAHTYRKVVLPKTLVRTVVDGNPSGATGVSEVNSLLMADLITEALLDLHLERGEPLTEEVIRAAVQKAGDRRMWRVKLEQYHTSSAPTIAEALLERPFLFLGYFFHREALGTTDICTVLDPRRWTTNLLSSPGAEKDNRAFFVLDAVRIAGTLLNVGVPPYAWARAIDAARAHSLELLMRVRTDPVLQPFVRGDITRFSESPFMGLHYEDGGEPMSIGAIYHVNCSPPYLLWNLEGSSAQEAEEPDLLSGEVGVWGEYEDDADRAARELFGTRPPPPTAKPVKSQQRVTSTRPATDANDGRPAPTGNDKPKPPPSQSAPLGKGARAVQGDLIEYSEDEEEAEDVAHEAESEDELEPGWLEATQEDWEAQNDIRNKLYHNPFDV